MANTNRDAFTHCFSCDGYADVGAAAAAAATDDGNDGAKQ